MIATLAGSRSKVQASALLDVAGVKEEMIRHFESRHLRSGDCGLTFFIKLPSVNSSS